MDLHVAPRVPASKASNLSGHAFTALGGIMFEFIDMSSRHCMHSSRLQPLNPVYR